MEKIFNTLSVVMGIVGGSIVSLLGGWDELLWAISVLVIVDYITGIIKAVYLKELSSEVGYKGLLKKILIFIVILLACIIQKAFSDTIPLREIVIVFYAVNEALSILENVSEILPVPDTLKEVLVQLRDNNNDTE